MKRRLAVFFPGTGYTCQKPLLFRSAAQYEARGYEIWKLDYGDVDFAPFKTVAEAIDAVKPRVLEQTEKIDFSRYDDVVFVSKSLGTAVALWLDAARGAHARHLMLTPIQEALPALTGPDRVIAAVLGTRDPHLNASELAALCAERDIPCLLIEGVGHRLAHGDDPEADERILRRVAALCT